MWTVAFLLQLPFVFTWQSCKTATYEVISRLLTETPRRTASEKARPRPESGFVSATSVSASQTHERARTHALMHLCMRATHFTLIIILHFVYFMPPLPFFPLIPFQGVSLKRAAFLLSRCGSPRGRLALRRLFVSNGLTIGCTRRSSASGPLQIVSFDKSTN